MKYLSILALLITLNVAIVCATTATSILDIGSSADQIGAAGIQHHSNTATHIFENPAYLGSTTGLSMSAFYTDLMTELSYRNIAFAKRYKKYTLAFGYMGVGVDGIAKTSLDSNNEIEIDSYYSAKHTVYKLGLQVDKFIKYTDLGLSTTYVHNAIDTVTGKGNNISMGLFFNKNKHSASFYIDNLLKTKTIDYSNQASESFPLITTCTYAKEFKTSRFLSQLKLRQDRQALYALALIWTPPEFNVNENENIKIDILMGVKNYYYLTNIKNKFSLGTRLQIDALTFSYSFTKSDYLNLNNQSYVSITLHL